MMRPVSSNRPRFLNDPAARFALALAVVISVLATPGVVVAQADQGPEDLDWGLDGGETQESDKKKNDPEKKPDSIPDAIWRTVQSQYVEFRNRRLRNNREVNAELLRVIDRPLQKVYASLMIPRRTLKRARGRVEAGLLTMLVRISGKLKKNQRVARLRWERADAAGGQGSVLIHTPGAAGGSLDPIFFVYRVKNDGSFESDVIFRR